MSEKHLSAPGLDGSPRDLQVLSVTQTFGFSLRNGKMRGLELHLTGIGISKISTAQQLDTQCPGPYELYREDFRNAPLLPCPPRARECLQKPLRSQKLIRATILGTLSMCQMMCKVLCIF